MGSLNSITGSKAEILIQELQSLGASKIEIISPPQNHVDIDELTVDSFIITLSSDVESRKKIFKWQAKFARRQGFDPVKDLGQNYLFLKWS